jgi:hypothetical protein
LKRERDGPKVKQLEAQLEAINGCESQALADERDRSFYVAIASALGEVDEAFVTKGSLVDRLRRALPFDLQDLIGQPNQVAFDLLRLTGIALNSERIAQVSTVDNIVQIEKSLAVGFDSQGLVFSVDIPFFESDKGGKPYQRHFLSGLSHSSSPQAFVSKYGAPADSGCFSVGSACQLTFSTNKADVVVLFNEADRSLRAIWLRKPGAWTNLVKQKDEGAERQTDH